MSPRSLRLAPATLARRGCLPLGARRSPSVLWYYIIAPNGAKRDQPRVVAKNTPGL